MKDAKLPKILRPFDKKPKYCLYNYKRSTQNLKLML